MADIDNGGNIFNNVRFIGLQNGTYLLRTVVPPNSVNFTTPGLTPLYTVPAGWNVVIESSYVSFSGITGPITGAADFTIGTNVTADNMIATRTIPTTITTADSFVAKAADGIQTVAVTGNTISINVTTAFTGPSVADAKIFLGIIITP